MPMSLFAADGTMLHCSAKSKLMDILEKMFSADTSHVAPPDIPQLNKCFAIIDTIADVHQWTKLAGLRHAMICQLISFIQRKNDEYDELHVVFDRYDIPKSFKPTTRHLRLGDSYPEA